jgi:hypothetical protein
MWITTFSGLTKLCRWRRRQRRRAPPCRPSRRVRPAAALQATTLPPPPPVAVQWMTVQGAGAAAKAAGAAGHEEGARALPALRGAAGPLALAPPPPPDAPAFDAVAYGMAPPLSPGRGAAAAAGGLVGRDGRWVLVAGGAAVVGGAPPEPGVAPPEPRRVQSVREAAATKRAAGRQRRDRPGADAQGLTLPELEAPAVVVAVAGVAAGGGAIGVVRPATTREARSAGLEVGGGGRAGGRARRAWRWAGRLLAEGVYHLPRGSWPWGLNIWNF